MKPNRVLFVLLISFSVIACSPAQQTQVKAQNRKVYCWYGYQEKKLGTDENGMLKVYAITNYGSEIFELQVPPKITNDDVVLIIKKHYEKNCPIVNKEREGTRFYTITGVNGPGVSSTYQNAVTNRKNALGDNIITFNICSLEELQRDLSNAQHFSNDDPNKNGVNLYCIASWEKYGWNKEEGHILVTRYETEPFKIRCASKDNMNDIPEIVKDHIKKYCNIPDGYIIGVSDFGSYREALYEKQKIYSNNTVLAAELCLEDKLQDEICSRR